MQIQILNSSAYIFQRNSAKTISILSSANVNSFRLSLNFIYIYIIYYIYYIFIYINILYYIYIYLLYLFIFLMENLELRQNFKDKM